MITRLTNFIGNKKGILGIIFFIVVSMIVYNIFFYTTKKRFDTDGDGKIDKIEYYRKGVKVKEEIHFDKVVPAVISYVYWNKEGSIDKIVQLFSDEKFALSRDIDIYSEGIKVNKYGEVLIKQEAIKLKSFDKKRRRVKTERVGRYYIYSKERKISFAELEKEDGVIYSVISFDPHGRISQTKEDKDSNGKFEYYEFYEHGKKTAVGYDYDEDGEIDKKEEVKNKSR